MTKKIFLILFVILCSQFDKLIAQSPGYLGKKISIGYGFHTSPTINGSNANGNSIIGRKVGSGETGYFAFNTMHEGFIEHALKKRFSIGLSAKYYKTTYDNGLSLSVYYQYANNTGGFGNVNYYGSPKGLYTIKGINYLLYGKLFYRKYVAPWGRYMTFGINVKTYKCEYNPDIMYLESGNSNSGYYNQYVPPKFSDFGPTKQKFIRYDLLFGLGKTKIIANRIILDYGFNTNVLAFMMTFFDAIGEDTFIDKVDNSHYIRKTAPWRVRGVNRFNVFFKVGYLF